MRNPIKMFQKKVKTGGIYESELRMQLKGTESYTFHPTCLFCQKEMHLFSCGQTSEHWQCYQCNVQQEYGIENGKIVLMEYNMDVLHKGRWLRWYFHLKRSSFASGSSSIWNKGPIFGNNNLLLIIREPTKITPQNIEAKLSLYLTFS